MSDPLIRSCDNYVILEPGKKEQILNSEETIKWLEAWLKQFNELPKDLSSLKSINTAAQHLLDTACELQVKPGFTLQWFAVRLDPPDYE